jgi:DNA-binding transcriptional regulator GbsR (MarR family)
MTESSLPASYSRFIETMGLLWEAEGLPRIAGRIFGFLALQIEPCSLDDIAAGLGVSKASVSTDARRLEHHGLVVRVGRPGDRRDYYAISPDAPVFSIAQKLERLRRFSSAIDGILDPEELPPAIRDRFANMKAYHERVVHHLEELLAELRAPQEATTRPTSAFP